MSTGNPTPKPKKGSRVAGVQLPPSRFVLARDLLKRADVLSRIGLCCLAAILMWLVTFGWERPFAYSVGDVPERAITARVPFEKVDSVQTAREREIKSLTAMTVYKHDQERVTQLFHQFEDRVRSIVQSEETEPKGEIKESWKDFMHGLSTSSPEGDALETSQEFYGYFAEFKEQFKEEADVDAFLTKVDGCLVPIRAKGTLAGLQHSFDEQGGDMDEIRIVAGEGAGTPTRVEEVRDEALPTLEQELKKTLTDTLARHAFAWLEGKLSLIHI